jgi:hypothetical protein
MYRAGLILLWLVVSPSWALEFSSGETKTTVVELYTSEGCSSCPPADNWLSSLKSDPRLFKTLLPLAFHVDYWDQLGWPDPYASPAFSQRQRELVRQDLLSQVYTPGIVVNSQEWRDWFSGQRQLDDRQTRPGRLQAELQQDQLTVSFDSDAALTLHVAVLGMGLQTDVQAGENRGRQLTHDFVVLEHWQQAGSKTWKFTLPELADRGQQRTALALWLTAPDSLRVVQATGSYID